MHLLIVLNVCYSITHGNRSSRPPPRSAPMRPSPGRTGWPPPPSSLPSSLHTPSSRRRRRNRRRAKPVWRGGDGSPRRSGGSWRRRRPVPDLHRRCSQGGGGPVPFLARIQEAVLGDPIWSLTGWCCGTFSHRLRRRSTVLVSGLQHEEPEAKAQGMVVWWRPSPSPEVVGRRGVVIPHLVPASSSGCEGAGEYRALTVVIATMTAFVRRSLVEGIVGAAFHPSIRAISGETLDLGSDDGDALCLSPS
jgi:hypothetical protein